MEGVWWFVVEIVGIIVMFSGLVKATDEGSYTMLILGFVLMVAAFVIKIVGDKKRKEKRPLSVTYDANSTILTVRKKEVYIDRVVKIAKDKNEVISYKPKEYVYTGATVGGVTTGGIHEQGGYNYVSGYRDTGRYQLQYEDEKFRRYLITKIQLSDELYNKAKESPIKDYLDNEKKQIKVVEELRPSSVVRQQMEMGNFQTARQIFANEMVEGYPTYDKCQKIINWLKA